MKSDSYLNRAHRSLQCPGALCSSSCCVCFRFLHVFVAFLHHYRGIFNILFLICPMSFGATVNITMVMTALKWSHLCEVFCVGHTSETSSLLLFKKKLCPFFFISALLPCDFPFFPWVDKNKIQVLVYVCGLQSSTAAYRQASSRYS